MPSTFSPSLRLELIGTGEQSGVWGTTTNSNLGTLVEQALTGNTSLNVTAGNIILTALNGVVDQSRSAVLFVTGTPGTTRILTIPNVTKTYTVKNTSDSTVQVKTSGGSPFNVPTLSEAYIYCDGANVITGRVITDGANTILSQSLPFNSPAFTGVPTAPTAAFGTNTTQLATTAFVQSALPAGLIVMWSGSIASIPTGWALCDGTSGRPDLRDRFIVGAGNTYAVGATGGANSVTLTTDQIPSHSHSGTTNNTDVAHTHTFTSGIQSADHTHSGTTALASIDHTHSGTTASENQNHTHGYSGSVSNTDINHYHYFSAGTSGVGDHAHGYTAGTYTSNNLEFNNDFSTTFSNGTTGAGTGGAGAHSHSVAGDTGYMSSNNVHSHSFSGNTGEISNNHQHAFTSDGMNSNVSHSHSITTGVQSANHTHSGTTDSASIDHNHTFTTNTTGGGQAHENRPPYYALAYIIKT